MMQALDFRKVKQSTAVLLFFFFSTSSSSYHSSSSSSSSSPAAAWSGRREKEGGGIVGGGGERKKQIGIQDRVKDLKDRKEWVVFLQTDPKGLGIHLKQTPLYVWLFGCLFVLSR